MTKQWFVLHTLPPGAEVKRSHRGRVRIEEMGEFIGEVVIPTEKVSEVKNGVKTTVTRKFFPGYVLINLALYDEGRNVLEPTWRFLKETSGVIGFIGGERPMPLSTAEVDAIVNQVADKSKEKAKPKVNLSGRTVKIIEGTVMSFKRHRR
jgi:transcriptional antiterminator NusG